MRKKRNLLRKKLIKFQNNKIKLLKNRLKSLRKKKSLLKKPFLRKNSRKRKLNQSQLSRHLLRNKKMQKFNIKKKMKQRKWKLSLLHHPLSQNLKLKLKRSLLKRPKSQRKSNLHPQQWKLAAASVKMRRRNSLRVVARIHLSWSLYNQLTVCREFHTFVSLMEPTETWKQELFSLVEIDCILR